MQLYKYQDIIYQYIIYARKKIDIFMKCLYSNSFIRLGSFYDQCIEVTLNESTHSILFGILLGPETLLELREDMMLAISSLSVGSRNIALSLSFERQSEKRFSKYFMLFLQFQLWRQSNYHRGLLWYHHYGFYSFQRNKEFNSFPFFLKDTHREKRLKTKLQRL